MSDRLVEPKLSTCSKLALYSMNFPWSDEVRIHCATCDWPAAIFPRLAVRLGSAALVPTWLPIILKRFSWFSFVREWIIRIDVARLEVTQLQTRLGVNRDGRGEQRHRDLLPIVE